MNEIFTALGLDPDFEVTDRGELPSLYQVTPLAAHSIAAVGVALGELVQALGLAAERPAVSVDQRLASLWFGSSTTPIDWDMPPLWDAIAGDYCARDGWIKLHTNLPHHRMAALSVLGCAEDRGAVEQAGANWNADDLETKIVSAGGVAAAMRSAAAWQAHPQGRAVAREPLIARDASRAIKAPAWQPTRERPLQGLKVLDLTRVLAGPVATRSLAGFGADVLRIDPPTWEEANVVPDITLGKRCARLDLTHTKDRQVFEALLAGADVFVHGYRGDALEGLGYGLATREAIAPNLIEVSLNAYGHTGPWAKRRGFDSLVQMSCGIAEAGMGWAGSNVPTPLPVQALDHATGYLIAAEVLRALVQAVRKGTAGASRLSLARTAMLLMAHQQKEVGEVFEGAQEADYSPLPEETPWGFSKRLRPALTVEGAPMAWPWGAVDLGSSEAVWG